MVILLAVIMTVIIQFHVIHNKIFPIFMWPNFCWQQYSIQNLDYNEWVGVMRVSCFSFGYEVTITLKFVLITVRIYHVFYDIKKKKSVPERPFNKYTICTVRIRHRNVYNAYQK